jgi:Methylmalonyl-CoA mutase, N-terminal domain/subunit
MAATTQLPPAAHDPLADAIARWRATVEAELKGVPFEKKLVTRTFEGIALQPLYTRADIAGLPDRDRAPGVAPFLRGVRPLGYKGRAWEVAQKTSGETPAEFNALLLADLMSGQNAVVLTPDRATRAGLDPDQAHDGEAGADGVSLAGVEDVSTALQGVDLAAVPVHVDAGACATPVAALYLESARRRGKGWAALTGSLTADPIAVWAESGTLPATLETLYGELAGWTGWAETYLRELRTIGVDAALWGDAGATATQELALALAASAEYLRELKRRGVAPKVAAARMVFRFSIGPQFFMELAKFRAFRPLWARVAQAFGVAPADAALAVVHAETARWNKTLLDPHVNMLRVTTEALSAVLGGCDALRVAPFDEVSGATTEFSRRIARNVHTLLAEEFHFAETTDPAGGSWYVEKLTDEVARAAWTQFQEIEARGGIVATLESGYVQQLVAKAAAEKNDAVAKRRLGLVGTNLFPNLKETPLAIRSSERPELRAARAMDVAKQRKPLAAPARCGAWGPWFGELLAAARAGATIGQLASWTLTSSEPVKMIVNVTPLRVAAGFEALRAATTAFAARTGARPRVFLAKMGPTSQHKARADFSAGFFAVAGFEVVAKQSFTTVESAVQAAGDSGARIVVLCSTDETYPELVPAFGAALKTAAPDSLLVLAGLPADAATISQFRESGVDEFIHIRANVHDVLANLLKQIGVLA